MRQRERGESTHHIFCLPFLLSSMAAASSNDVLLAEAEQLGLFGDRQERTSAKLREMKRKRKSHWDIKPAPTKKVESEARILRTQRIRFVGNCRLCWGCETKADCKCCEACKNGNCLDCVDDELLGDTKKYRCACPSCHAAACRVWYLGPDDSCATCGLSIELCQCCAECKLAHDCQRVLRKCNSPVCINCGRCDCVCCEACALQRHDERASCACEAFVGHPKRL
jgi:hypothetical protein